MASALARGIGEPVVACDVVAGKAEALVEAVGGEVVETPQQVAEQSDAIVLAHKPGQLEDVAGQLNGAAKVVVSILGGVPTTKLEAAYPGAAVHRFRRNHGLGGRDLAAFVGLDPGEDVAHAAFETAMRRSRAALATPESIA